MNGKGRPEKLTDELKRWITTRQAGLKKKLKAPALRAEIRLLLEKQVREEEAENGNRRSEELIQDEIKAKSPGTSRIQKYIKPDGDTVSFVDTPWHLGKTPELPAEAIAAIIEVQRWLEKEKDNPSFWTGTKGIKERTELFTNNRMTSGLWPLTIREALWISRLYRVTFNFTEQLFLKEHKQPVIVRGYIEEPYLLWQAAKTYSDYQRLCELSGTDFDTTRLDDALRSGGIGGSISGTLRELFTEYRNKKGGEK